MPKNQRLKVGLVFDDSLDSNDGVAQAVKAIGAWLSKSGHEVSYLVGETKIGHWSGGKVYSLSKNISVNFNGNRLSIPLPADKSRIKKVLDTEKFDVLHVMMPYSPFLAQRLIKIASPRTAIVATFHILPSGLLAKVGSVILAVAQRVNIKRIQMVISVSQPAADFAKKTFKVDSKVIPNPIDLSYYTLQKKLQDTNTTKKVVFLGRLVKRKGCEELIKAFALFYNAQAPQNIRLVIAGSGPQSEKLIKLASKLKIADKTDFLGYIDEQDKSKLLASADLACFPSLYAESFGIVLLEAMASGSKVVIGGDNPGYSSVLAEKPELLFNPSNTQEFADKLRHMLSETKLLESLHNWQTNEVKKYDINVIGPMVVEVYESAIAALAKKSHN
ncbi:MAG TPA: glycosyltransferase family 4 protein [Candidatus Babeliales bacterium]|nr:glycosyltransferase family 4 protein [Candidatus Babeliales bacterium]